MSLLLLRKSRGIVSYWLFYTKHTFSLKNTELSLDSVKQNTHSLKKKSMGKACWLIHTKHTFLLKEQCLSRCPLTTHTLWIYSIRMKRPALTEMWQGAFCTSIVCCFPYVREACFFFSAAVVCFIISYFFCSPGGSLRRKVGAAQSFSFRHLTSCLSGNLWQSNGHEWAAES